MVQGTTIVGKLSIGRLLLKRIAPIPVVIRSLQNWEGDGGAKASGGSYFLKESSSRATAFSLSPNLYTLMTLKSLKYKLVIRSFVKL
jgi:hypothetical protein